MNPRLGLGAQNIAVILFHNTETLPLRMPTPAAHTVTAVVLREVMKRVICNSKETILIMPEN
jgi:hypothetical protein